MTDNSSTQPQQKEPSLAVRSLWQHHYDLFYKQDHEFDPAPYLFALAITAVSVIASFFIDPQPDPTTIDLQAPAIELFTPADPYPSNLTIGTYKNGGAPIRMDKCNFERLCEKQRAMTKEATP